MFRPPMNRVMETPTGSRAANDERGAIFLTQHSSACCCSILRLSRLTWKSNTGDGITDCLRRNTIWDSLWWRVSTPNGWLETTPSSTASTTKSSPSDTGHLGRPSLAGYTHRHTEHGF